MTRATVVDGKVILSEANHDTPAGTVVATIEIRGDVCTVKCVGDEDKPGRVGETLVDHLGTIPHGVSTYPRLSRYDILVDNWKLYPARVVAWIERMI